MTLFDDPRSESLSLSPKHQYGRSLEIQFGIESRRAGIQRHGVHGTILQAFDQFADIGAPGDPNVLDGAGGRFCHTRRQTYGSTVRNKHPMNARRGRRSEDCPEILRILHPVEREEKPRLPLLRGKPEDLILRGIGFCRHQSHHALMISGEDQSVKSFTRLNL